MKAIIKINGKKISKKQAAEIYGADRIENRIADAIEEFINDPLTLCTWADGMEIIISRD